VEGAVVLGVLGSNTRRNRLRAFKLRPRVEKAALLAAMQLEIALGAFAIRIESGDEHSATIGAAGASYGAHHTRRAWAQMVGGTARTALGRLALWSFFLFPFFRVTIATVAVLAIHKRLRPPVLTDSYFPAYLHNYSEGLCA